MKSWMLIAVRMMLAGVFAYAVAAKVLYANPEDGAATMLSEWAGSGLASYMLIMAELLLVLWLLSGLSVRHAALVTVILLSGFSGLIINEIQKDRPKPCGCAGVVAALDDPAAVRRSLAISLGRNGLLIAGAAWLFLAQPTAERRGLQLQPTGGTPVLEH
jgi:hypothetical protein